MTIQERFDKFHRDNPEVYELFKRFSWELVRSGRLRYSADAIIHRIRWHYAVNVDYQKNGDFKMNNNFSSRYARKLIAESPSFDEFFETRELKEGSG